MKFTLQKTSTLKTLEPVNIKNLNQLLEFVKANGSIIISENIENLSTKFDIEIYDSYRE